MAISLKKIQASMIEQLEKNGVKTDFYSSLVDDYIYAEKQARKMRKEINEFGLTMTATSAQGKTYDKENPAIKAHDLFIKQKLSIIKQLGLTIETIEAGAEDEGYCDI